MERKSLFSRIRSLCIAAAVMLCAVFMTSATVHAAIDLSMGGSQFTLVEKHAYWSGGLHMSEFKVGTDDPAFAMFDMTTHTYTTLTEGVDYTVVRISRMFNGVETNVTNSFNKNLPGDYTYVIKGIAPKYEEKEANVDRFILHDPNNPDMSKVAPASVTTQPAAETVTQKGVSIKKLTKYKKAFKVTWKKSTKKNATGYQIRYSLKPTMENAKTVSVKGYSKTSKKISKLKAKTKYYVQIRVYKTISGGKVYSPWSKTKTVKTK